MLADRRDPYHEAAVRERRARSDSPTPLLVTTDYVLDETFTRLFARCSFPVAQKFSEAILKAEEAGLLKLERIHPERFREAYRLRLRYKDKPSISFTDLTSFVVMKELGTGDVLTGNAHFEQVQLGFRRLPR